MSSIYLIDDQPITNFITRKLLEVQGIKSLIIDFTNPVEAFASLQKDNDVLVFLDLNMPEMSGWEFLDQLKVLDIQAKIFILTSSTSELDKQKAKDYPCVVGYIEKPLTRDKFASLSASFPQFIF